MVGAETDFKKPQFPEIVESTKKAGLVQDGAVSIAPAAISPETVVENGVRKVAAGPARTMFLERHANTPQRMPTTRA